MKQKKLSENTQKLLKFLLPALGVIIILGVIYVSYSPVWFHQQTLAECLTAKGVTMYGADSCSHCQDQKALIGKDFENIHYINCEFDKKLCDSRGITSYPIWSFGNKVLVGTQTKSALASFADCPTIP